MEDTELQDVLSTLKDMIKTEVVFWVFGFFQFSKSAVDYAIEFCTSERKNETKIYNT